MLYLDLYREKRVIYSNHTLNFPFNKIEDILDIIKLQNTSMGIDEFSEYYSAYDGKLPKDIFRFARQVRKEDNRIYISSQVINDIPASLRRVVDYIFVCYKLHYDNNPCLNDKCRQRHFFIADENVSNRLLRIPYEMALKVFQMYNTNELIQKAIVED